MEEHEKILLLRSKKSKSISDVLEEEEVLIDTNFFDEFSGTKYSALLSRFIDKQSPIDTRLFKKEWRTLNCTPKTIKAIQEIQENLLCVGKSKELITKKSVETTCWCSNDGLPLNSKNIINCCMKDAG